MLNPFGTSAAGTSRTTWFTLVTTGFLITGTTGYWYGKRSVPLQITEHSTETATETKEASDSDKKGLIEFRLTTTTAPDGTKSIVEEHGVQETVHTVVQVQTVEVTKEVEKIVEKEADSPRNKLALLMPPKYGSPEWKEVRLTYGYRVVGPWSVEVEAGIDGTLFVGIGYSW